MTENIIAALERSGSQPSQGSHPEDSGQSVLEYLLQDSATIAPDMGIFLPRTYPMHPNICSLISNQVYDAIEKFEEVKEAVECEMDNENYYNEDNDEYYDQDGEWYDIDQEVDPAPNWSEFFEGTWKQHCQIQ
jgi:hypothetical protein